ncbi:MAG: T9SS type A sorting domain-containing protein [Candidatus Pacebacteria bacterium]|nr:T9SS type A sorting domain-containing protein [Candidatus Paceibacterota bacterium]
MLLLPTRHLGGNFSTAVGSHIYDLATDASIGTNSNEFTPLDKIIRLDGGGFYTKARHIASGDTVLIHTDAATSDWTILTPHKGSNTAFTMSDEREWLRDLIHINNKPGYVYVLYGGTVHTTNAAKRAQIYVFNFETQSFEIVWNYPLDVFFVSHVENISSDELVYIEGFGSRRISILKYNGETQSFDETHWDVGDLANIGITGTRFVEYNNQSNELLIGIIGMTLQGQGLEAFFRFRLGDLEEGQVRMEEVFRLSGVMSQNHNAFYPIHDEILGEGYIWYNRPSSGQNIFFENFNIVFAPRGLYLIAPDFSSITPYALGEGITDIGGFATDLYATNGKIYITHQPSNPAGLGITEGIHLRIDDQWILADGLVIFDYNPPIINPVDPILTESIDIINAIESLEVGKSHFFSALQNPFDVDSPGLTWSITTLESRSGGTVATIDQNGRLTALSHGKVLVRVTANDNGLFDEIMVSIFEKETGPTSIHTPAKLEYVLYPNPARDYIVIAGDVTDITLYNMIGKRMDVSMTPTNDGVTGSVHHLPAGMYVIHTNKGTVSFVKH